MNKSSATMQFPFATGALMEADWNREQVESLHMQFLAQWRQSLSALVPAVVQIRAGDIQLKSYQQYLQDVSAQADIQVFEIEALQSLCAWSFDSRWVSTAVDCVFGGAGRIPVRDLPRRVTHIELGVRQRLVESLATAYESAWQAVYPIRLKTLRQEQQMASLRLTSPQEAVLHAQFVIAFNRVELDVNLCLPRRALDCLQPTSPDDDGHANAQPVAWSRSLQHQLHATPVEAVAVLCEKELTVAQLLSLSIGQVLPIELSEPVRFMVDGVSMLSGRYGVRHGNYALKVEHINEQHAYQEAVQSASADAASLEAFTPSPMVPEQAQADLTSAAQAMNQLADQIQKNEGAQ
jgi:flagellar motor switch protein FliM